MLALDKFLCTPLYTPSTRVHSFVRQCHVSLELSISSIRDLPTVLKNTKFVHHPGAFDAQRPTANKPTNNQTSNASNFLNLKKKYTLTSTPSRNQFNGNTLLHNFNETPSYTVNSCNTNHNTRIPRAQILPRRTTRNVLMIPDIPTPPPTCY